MENACKPLQRRGARNVFCPLHNRCLNHAIKESWQYWTCRDCRHKLDQGAGPEMQVMTTDSIAYYDLRLKPKPPPWDSDPGPKVL